MSTRTPPSVSTPQDDCVVAKRLSKHLNEAFNEFLAKEVPRLRPIEHSRIVARVEEIVEQVRKTAEGEAWNAAVDKSLEVIAAYSDEHHRALAARVKGVGR